MKKLISSIEVLSADEVRLIHDSSVELLETVGINAPCDELLRRCEAAGAVADYDSQMLRIPRRVLEDALERMKAANSGRFAEEQARQDISAHISTQVQMTDYITRRSRYGTRDDNRKGIALVDTLENFPENNAVTVPHDVPHQISDLICYQDIFKYAKKPGGTYILTPVSARYILELNKLMSRETGYLLETISPLSYKQDTLEMALFFADNGGGLGLGPMTMSAATAPVTIAGSMTLENAEILGSLFIIHTLTGAVPGYSAPMHSMDPRSMLCSFGSANQALFGVACAQMARYYGISAMTNAGLTDALLPDFQGGLEKGLTAAFNFLAGARGMGAQGIVGADQGNCFEQLVIDNEWIRYYNYIVGGFEVTPETIALDVIREVGPKGNFLTEEHTTEYLRESFLSSEIFLRDSWNNWINGSREEILDRAHAYVERVTAGYREREPVISASLCEEIDRIVDAAVAEVSR